jgi:alpha-glucosidase (family GH31 glycosyl hydrolase)
MPLYVRAGSILPLGPVKQHVYEESSLPLTISIYPGADASFLLYEDDGKSFNYRKGEWMGIQMSWKDSRRVLTLRLAEGSKILPPSRRNIVVKLNETERQFQFDGKPLEIKL